jgi:hypothetical protein
VDVLVRNCDGSELLIWDIELLIDTVEESFAERATGEICDDAVE